MSGDLAPVAEDELTASRARLPDDRNALTRKVELTSWVYDEHGKPKCKKTSDLYITIGTYADGTIAEVFARIDKVGSRMNVLVDAWCTSLSIGLQYGIPLEVFTSKFKGMGDGGVYWTSDDEIPRVRSPIDYIAKWLERKAGHEESVPDNWNGAWR
jgi:ribonucleoside-diphosphate reductase alpha chain